jgi:hypothetical protein
LHLTDRKEVNPECKTDHAVHPKKAAKSSMVKAVTVVITTVAAISSSHSEEVNMVVRIDREMEMIVSHITETICAKMVVMTEEADMAAVAQDPHIKIGLEILLDTREVKGLVVTAKEATKVVATVITIVEAVTEVVTMEEVSTTKIDSTKTEMVLQEVTAHAITTMVAQEIAEAVAEVAIDPVTNAEVVLPKAIVTSDDTGLFKFISNPSG